MEKIKKNKCRVRKILTKTSRDLVLRDVSGPLITNDFDISNIANNYFINVGPNLASKIPDVNRDKYFEALISIEEGNNKIKNFPVIPLKKIESVIKTIDASKSSNIANIENRIFACYQLYLRSVIFII